MFAISKYFTFLSVRKKLPTDIRFSLTVEEFFSPKCKPCQFNWMSAGAPDRTNWRKNWIPLPYVHTHRAVSFYLMYLRSFLLPSTRRSQARLYPSNERQLSFLVFGIHTNSKKDKYNSNDAGRCWTCFRFTLKPPKSKLGLSDSVIEGYYKIPDFPRFKPPR